MYTIDNNGNKVLHTSKDVQENYVPTQNTDMIYIGMGISIIVLVLLCFMLYRKMSKQNASPNK
jgi:uncharacterized membrane protein affecting hemolysin expression